MYRQRFGAAMGSPVSPIVANFFMEFLEQLEIATAPLDCRPHLWKRYVDDVLKIINKGQVQSLTDHLNQIDTTNSIKFTHEEEKDSQIPFLDTLIIQKPDGTIKLLVYRKPTHTDQYLNFMSEHPLHQKMGVIRTLFDRMNSVVTEEEDRLIEEERVCAALRNCGYREWAMNKVKDQMTKKSQTKVKKSNPKPSESKSKGMVVIPYVNGVAECVQRVYKKYNVATAMKPYSTLRNLLVHPKDKRNKLQCSNCIYEIGCKNCDNTYVGEASRHFGVRLSEHQTEVKKATNRKYTRSEHRASELEQTKSAISDHIARANHVIDWDEAKILGREHNKKSREVREAIEIRRRGAKTLNREGTYLLSHVYDPLIKKSRTVKETVSRRLLITCQSGSDGHSAEVSRRSETKY